MHIGPLTLKPPVAPLVSGLSSLMTKAGVIVDGAMTFPGPRLATDGSIPYVNKVVGFDPLLMVAEADSAAIDAYARAGGDPKGESRFAREARMVESVFSMGTGDISRAAVDNISMVPDSPDMQGVIQRASLLKGSTLADLIATVRADREGLVHLLNTDLIQEVAHDADFISTLIWRRGGPAAICHSALFSMMSGILQMVGDTEDASELAASFLSSSSLFSEAGMHVAAALSSEIAAVLEKSIPDLFMGQNSVSTKTAGRWLAAALNVGNDDPAARLVCVHRGLVAAYMSGHAVEERRRLLMMSAGINGAAGRHEDEGRDYLRILFDIVMAGGWNAHSWQRVADTFVMAGAAYTRAGGPAEIQRSIERLERISSGIASHVRDDLAPLDREVESRPDDDVVRWRRAIARSRYGDFDGALADLKWVELSQAGSPWLLSEMGHVYHLMADHSISLGVTEDAGRLLSLASGCMSRALEVEEESGERIPILHARMGALYVTMGSFQEGISALREAVGMAPGSREIKDYLERAIAVADKVGLFNPFTR